MNSLVAVSILVIVVVIGSLQCNANKTELVVAVLEVDPEDKAVTVGINLSIEAAKNSSDFKAFFDKYEIVIDGPHHTRAAISNAIFFSGYALKDKPQSTGLYPMILLGPNRPDEVFPVLKVVRFYRKLMVTYLTTNSEVTEIKDYRFTFAPTAFAFNAANFRLMDYFKWKGVAIVYDFLDSGGLYVKVVSDLIKNEALDIIGFEAINTDFVLQQDLNQEIRTKLKKLKKLDAKIFLGEFNARGASLVFCELFKMKLYGPEFVWILHPEAGTIEDWYKIAEHERTKKNKTDTCTKEQYQKAADRAFIFEKNILYRSDENTTTASGLSLREVFSKPLVEDLKEDSEKIEMANAFDVMWAIILALKGASVALQTTSSPLEYNVKELVGSDVVTKTIKNKLRNVNFEGLTGSISFTEDEEREGIIVVKQFQDGGTKLVPIGQHFTKLDKFELFNATKDTLWKPDGRVPSDQFDRQPKTRIIPLELLVVFSTAASIGILLGIVFLVFNRYYRKYKFIRLSAPLFNDVVVVGCILCLSTVFLFGLRDFKEPQTTMPPICQARAWILNIGFSLAFGGMFIKTWRIYRICTNKRLKVRLGPLSDWWMLAMVGGIVLIDVALLTAWKLADPLEYEKYNFTEERNDATPYIIIKPTLNTCTATHMTIWLALIYVYKGILLLYGLFLAYETRNVVYAHLNDSRVIGICVYNVVVLSTIGAFLTLILNNEQYVELYAALSVCIIIPATVTTSLIFIPKLAHRVKMNSLDDETGETTINHTRGHPSFDISSTYYGTEMGGEKFVDASSTNTLCVHQNGGLSPIPSPTPPAKIQELSPKALED